MKNLIFSLSILLIGSLSLNAQQTELLDHPTDAQVLLSHYDSRPNTRIALLSATDQEIKLRVDYDEGSTFTTNSIIKVENGQIISTPSKHKIGGLHKLGEVDTEEMTIRRTEAGKPITIQWGMGGEPIIIPGTAPALSGWQKMPPSPSNATAEKIIAGGKKLLVIDNDSQLHEWNYATKSWKVIHQSVQSAAVDMFNAVWVVKNDGLYRLRTAFAPAKPTGNWDKVSSPAVAKTVIAGGTRVCIIDANRQLHEWNFFNKQWKEPIKNVWGAAIDKNNSLWKLEGTTIYRKKIGEDWKKMTGAAKEIFAGSRRVFITGTDDQQYEWNFRTDNSWTRAGVYPISTAVDINSTIYYIDKKNVIHSLYYPKTSESIVPDITKNDGEWTFGYGTPGEKFSPFPKMRKEGPKDQVTRKYIGNWWSVAQNTSNKAWTDSEHNTYPPKANGAMVFHPGKERNQSSKAHFTAKTAGTYTFNIKWSLIDAQGDLVSAEVYTNASSKGTGWTNLIKENVTNELPGKSLSKEFKVQLKAGEVVSVEIENAGRWNNDSTLIEMSAK